MLLRERYRSRAELARASGLPYQALRTYTDGLWTADHMSPVRVLAALSEAVTPADLQRAVRQAMVARTDESEGPPSLTWGQRVVLESLRGFDDGVLVQATARTRPDRGIRRRRGGPSARRDDDTQPAAGGPTPLIQDRRGKVGQDSRR